MSLFLAGVVGGIDRAGADVVDMRRHWAEPLEMSKSSVVSGARTPRLNVLVSTCWLRSRAFVGRLPFLQPLPGVTGEGATLRKVGEYKTPGLFPIGSAPSQMELARCSGICRTVASEHQQICGG